MVKRDWVEPGDFRPLCPSENIRAVVLKVGVLKSAVLASSGNLLERLTHWSPTLWAFITLDSSKVVLHGLYLCSRERPGLELQPAALHLLCITGSELGEEGRIVTRCDAANKDGDWWEKDTEGEKHRLIAIEIPNLLETMWPRTFEWQPLGAPILCSSTNSTRTVLWIWLVLKKGKEEMIRIQFPRELRIWAD